MGKQDSWTISVASLVIVVSAVLVLARGQTDTYERFTPATVVGVCNNEMNTVNKYNEVQITLTILHRDNVILKKNYWLGRIMVGLSWVYKLMGQFVSDLRKWTRDHV